MHIREALIKCPRKDGCFYFALNVQVDVGIKESF
jgi:hypothetical protein